MEEKYLAGIFGIIAVLLITLILFAAPNNNSDFHLGQQRAAIIQLSGSITPSSNAFGSQGITPEKVRELNSQAVSRGASAIIYEWNSGGGAVVASKEIKREIESIKIPTVCRFRDVAASGAYLASLGCDRIIADSASVTGSIGVKSSYMEYSGLLEKLGIEYVNITAGRYKDVGSPFQNITQKEQQILEEKTEIIHQEFVSEVEEERNLTATEVRKISTGQIFLGIEAKNLSLVDKIGGRHTAIEKAENLTGTKLTTFEVETQPNFSLLSLLNMKTWFSGNSISPLKAELG